MDNILKVKSKIEKREICFDNKYVRPLLRDELQNAIDLIWEVFLQFEAPEYSQEGINHFRASLDEKERK